MIIIKKQTFYSVIALVILVAILTIAPALSEVLAARSSGNTFGTISVNNSTTTALSDGATYTGTGEKSDFPDVMVTLKTDAPGTLKMEHSHDGTNWDSSLTFGVSANIYEIHVLVKGDRFYRTVFTDDNDGITQTYLRLQTGS